MKNKNRIFFAFLGLLLVTVTMTHIFGYRIYGYPYYKWNQIPESEDWSKVIEIKKEGVILLSDNRTIDLSPLVFTENYINKDGSYTDQLFNCDPTKVLIRYDQKEKKWYLRQANTYYHSKPQFFPKRIYPYYETELIEFLTHFHQIWGNQPPATTIDQNKTLQGMVSNAIP